jgi:hypothetical protein
VPKKEEIEILEIEGRELRATHPNKPYFSRQVKLSKLDLVQYYFSVAPGALAGIRDRPVVLKRFVDGAEHEPFYQKRVPESRPFWLRTVTLRERRLVSTLNEDLVAITKYERPEPVPLGSKIQSSPVGSSLTRFASMGKRGGLTGSCTPHGSSMGTVE